MLEEKIFAGRVKAQGQFQNRQRRRVFEHRTGFIFRRLKLNDRQGDREAMFKRIRFLLLLLTPAVVLAQSPRSAVGGEGVLSTGGEVSFFSSDWNCSSSVPFGCGSQQLYGIAPFFDFNFHSRFSVEGEARWLHWNGPAGEVESNYLAGPRYRLFQLHGLNGWAKVLLGGGWLTSPGYPGPISIKGSYFAYAPGGTLNYHVKGPWSVRADYEFQEWPSFVGPSGIVNGQFVQHDNGLTPNGVSFGVAYRILGR